MYAPLWPKLYDGIFRFHVKLLRGAWGPEGAITPILSSGLPGCWKWDFVGFTGGYIPLASQLEESTSADAVEDCKTLVPMAAALRCLETDPGRNALVMGGKVWLWR